VHAVGLVPALSIIAGAACAAYAPRPGLFVWLPPVFLAASIVAWCRRSTRLTVACLVAGFWTCAVILTGQTAGQALHPSLRAVLDREIGGFDISTLGPEGEHDPILTRAVLLEDASPRDGYVSLRVEVTALRLNEIWQPVEGGVIVSVGGAAPPDRVLEWRARRTIQAPMVFRRPARFLNDGVPDFEDALARDGTTLFGTVKSALVVEVASHGGPIDELAADIRVHVRTALATWVAPHSTVSAAIAAAVLIGDRTGVPDGTREALQAAGTYHVIAISGGNIAIVAAGACGLLALIGIRGRVGALLTILVLIAFAAVVTAGPSVWRATLMAIAYFAARAADHRTPVWQATAVAAAIVLIVRPLDLGDPGFILTFGATMALVEGARRGATLLPASLQPPSRNASAAHQSLRRGGSKTRATGAGVLSWIVATVIGSLAVEAALLPVSASVFSRVTSAGVVLNLLAVPAMGVVQIAAMTVTLTTSMPLLAYGAGWTAHAAASVLVSSAHLVSAAPWLAARVPPPGAVIVLVYYAALLAAIAASRRLRVAGAIVFLLSLAAIVSGVDPSTVARGAQLQPPLRLTVFDVGQGESMLLEAGGRTLLVDTGGAPFGGGVDIGRRVLAPALWAPGIRSLDAMLVTHGDPDHLGGALAVADDFRPRQIWEGIRLPHHPPTRALLSDAARLRIPVAPLRAGQQLDAGDIRLHVLYPPPPDWERRRVRNDDSVVLEVVYRDVAILLTGDISADIEREIVPRLTPARIRILKVAHHGSRTSSSSALLETWRPRIALISCGRGNRFGHPTPEVLQRLEAIGATVMRTDLDGQITIETDGRSLRAVTFVRRHGGHGVISH
jgi:competence protein ComEC